MTSNKIPTITAEMVKMLRERTGAAMMACKEALTQTQGDLETAIDVLRKAGEIKAAKRAGKIAAEGKISIVADSANQRAFMLEMNCETDFVARDSHFRDFIQKVSVCGLAERVHETEPLLACTLDKNSATTIEQARLALVSQLGENIQLRRVAFLESTGIVGTYCHGDRIGVLLALDQKHPELAKHLAMHVAASHPLAVTPEGVPAAWIAKERDIFLAQAKESGKPEVVIRKMVEGRVNKFLNEVSLVNQPFIKDPNQTVAEVLKSHKAQVITFIRFELGEGIEKQSHHFAKEVEAQLRGNSQGNR
ncbi:MAG: translation elongation factor Ts [Coxiella sp. RIFCSPHIGHO2_12_FULL_44_14]|nr:MAG: translation elongation factor Ts [Coxiella sp. RIFCSPHIGHO2_12_FULL_44_14]